GSRVGDADLERDRGRAHGACAREGVLEELASESLASEAEIGRDLVDVELLVERDGEEVAADARRAGVLRHENAQIPVRLDELAREELPLPRDRKGLRLDAGDLVEIEGPRGPEAVGPLARLTERHASPRRRWDGSTRRSGPSGRPRRRPAAATARS